MASIDSITAYSSGTALICDLRSSALSQQWKHLIARVTHFTDPGGTAGWVCFVSWLIADALPTMRSHAQPPAWRRMGKVRRLRPAF